MYAWLCGIIFSKLAFSTSFVAAKKPSTTVSIAHSASIDPAVVEHQPLEGVAGIAVEFRERRAPRASARFRRRARPCRFLRMGRVSARERRDRDAAGARERDAAGAGVGDAGEHHRGAGAQPARTCAPPSRDTLTRPLASASAKPLPASAAPADDGRGQSRVDLGPRPARVVAAKRVAAQPEDEHGALVAGDAEQRALVRDARPRETAAPPASSFSTRPASPTMNKPPAAGRIAYRLRNFGLSVRSNHGFQVLPPSSVRKMRL